MHIITASSEAEALPLALFRPGFMRATVACPCRRAWSRPSRSSRTRMRSRVLRSEHRAWASLLLLTNKAPRSTLTSVSTLAKRQQRAKRRSARAHTLSIEGSSSKRIGKRDGQRCRSCICFLNDISEKLTGKRAEMFRCGPPRFTGTLYCGNVSSRAKKKPALSAATNEASTRNYRDEHTIVLIRRNGETVALFEGIL